MRKFTKKQEEQGADIDLTPMLDVVFIMLIFFIVVASFIKEAGIEAVGVVAPLMPLADPVAFARELDRCCSRVILDHYLIGDGSREGARTKRRGAPALLVANGYERWTRLEVLEEVAAVFRDVLGPQRVGVSKEGFNA